MYTYRYTHTAAHMKSRLVEAYLGTLPIKEHPINIETRRGAGEKGRGRVLAYAA
jgi:hypothetical protein